MPVCEIHTFCAAKAGYVPNAAQGCGRYGLNAAGRINAYGEGDLSIGPFRATRFLMRGDMA